MHPNEKHWSKRRYIATTPRADPESFVREGPTLTTFFLVDEGREDPHTTINGPLNGPSSARLRNTV